MAEISIGSRGLNAPKRRRSPGFEFFYRLFTEKPLGAFGAVVCVIFLFTGIFSDLIAPYGYNEMNPIDRLQAPSFGH